MRRRPRGTQAAPISKPPAGGPPPPAARCRPPAPRCAARTRGSRPPQSAVENARLQLGYATLLAPSHGHRGQAERRAGRAGAGRPEPAVDRARHATSGSRPTSRRRSWRRSRVGDPVEFNVDAYPGRDLPRQGREPEPGHRRAVRPAAAGQRHRQLHQGRAARARSASRWTAPADPAHPLRPGMSVDVTVTTD